MQRWMELSCHRERQSVVKSIENHICHLFHKQADRQISKIRHAYDLKETSTASHISAEINRNFFSSVK